MAEPWAGRVIDGRYAVESVLGTGGMGVVLRAHHRFTGAQVAVKMLHKELQLDPELEHRFLAEARAPNQIGHPAIVQVLDAGRSPEGELYLAMELLVGQSLRDAMKRRLPPVEIRRIVRELLDALAAAHDRGFVHRDLKPENVFIAAPNAAVKLLDFGIAKGMKSATIGVPRTAAGVLLGTLAYMAPEQLHDASSVDPRADLWALGVMMYEMMTARIPFAADSIEQLFGLLARAEPDPIQKWIPSVAPEISAFFARALSRDPNARFGSAIEMSAALAQLPFEDHAITRDSRPILPPSQIGETQATGFSTASQTGPAPAVVPLTQHDTEIPATNRARPIALAIAGVVVIGIAIAVGVGSTKKTSSSQPPPPAPTGSAAVVAPPALDCEASCAWLNGCGLRTTRCVAECQRLHGFGDCLSVASHSCDAFTACFLGANCGTSVGTGAASCNATLTCQLTCKPGDGACACTCATAAAPAKLTLWLSYAVCASNCGADAECRKLQCTPKYDRCHAQ